MADIFISYAREDLETARVLAAALESMGWSVWWDRRTPAGKHFADVIEEALNASRCVIAVWSRASIRSGWVRDEAQAARDRDKLIPVFAERVEPPLGFRGIHAVDLVGWNGSRDAAEFQQLVADVGQALGAPRNDPPPPPPSRSPWKRRVALIAGVLVTLLVAGWGIQAYLHTVEAGRTAEAERKRVEAAEQERLRLAAFEKNRAAEEAAQATKDRADRERAEKERAERAREERERIVRERAAAKARAEKEEAGRERAAAIAAAQAKLPSASKVPSAGFNTAYDDLRHKVAKLELSKSSNTGRPVVRYDQQLFGQTFWVHQELDDQNRTSKATLGRASGGWRSLRGGKAEGDSKSSTERDCSHAAFKAMVEGLEQYLGKPHAVTPPMPASWDEPGIKYRNTTTAAGWRLPDGTKAQLRTFYLDNVRGSGSTNEWECRIDVCVLPSGYPSGCTSVPGLVY